MAKLSVPKLGNWDILFAVFCLVIVIVLGTAVSGHVRPNAPLVGGDVYQAFGTANFIDSGHYPWQDSVYKGEYTWYPWLFHVLAVIASKITFTSLTTVFIWAPVVITPLLMFTYYKLGKELYNPAVGFLTAFLVLFFSAAGSNAQVTVPVSFSYVLSGLYFLYLYRAHKSHEVRDIGLAGIMLGLVGLTHMHTLFVCLVVLGSYLLTSFLFKNIGAKGDNVATGDKAANGATAANGAKGAKGFKIPVQPVKLFFIVLVVGLLLSQPFIYPILKEYQFQTTRPIAWEDSPTPPAFSTVFLGSTFKTIPLFYLGMFGLFLAYKRRNEADLITFSLVLAAYLGSFHHVATLPLMNFMMQPYKFSFLRGISLALASAFALWYIAKTVLKQAKLEPDRLMHLVIGIVILLILLFPSPRGYFNGQAFSGEWGANEPLIGPYADTVEWVLENTDKDAVLFTGPLTGNIVNSWTGRWVSTSEIAHSSVFLDIEQKYADSQEFYLASPERAHEIATQYGADYVLINVYEYQMYLPKGFDPAYILNSGYFSVEQEWEYQGEGGSFPIFVLSVNK